MWWRRRLFCKNFIVGHNSERETTTRGPEVLKNTAKVSDLLDSVCSFRQMLQKSDGTDDLNHIATPAQFCNTFVKPLKSKTKSCPSITCWLIQTPLWWCVHTNIYICLKMHHCPKIYGFNLTIFTYAILFVLRIILSGLFV